LPADDRHATARLGRTETTPPGMWGTLLEYAQWSWLTERLKDSRFNKRMAFQVLVIY